MNNKDLDYFGLISSDRFDSWVEEAKTNRSVYKDSKIKLENKDNFIGQSKIIIQDVVEAFNYEERYVRDYRYHFSHFIMWFMAVVSVIILGLCLYSIFTEASIITIVALLASLVIETVGLLAIIFKYLFNKEHNKVLDVMMKYLEIKAEHEIKCNGDHNKNNNSE